MTDSSSALRTTILRNLMAAVTVSFVALSLGAAFGVLSGRGAFAGMLSAALIASITSALGGTRVQCSGPTGPMTTVMAAVVGFGGASFAARFPETSPDHFLNLTLFLTAGLTLTAAVLRLGRFITFIPNVVISGFMNGIAIIIWLDQIKRLFGLGGKQPLTGDLSVNLAVVVCTTVLVVAIPILAQRWFSRVASLVSGTFFAIVVMTAVTTLLGLDVERVSLAAGLRSWADFTSLVDAQLPREWSLPIVAAALPFALQLTVLGYLDTLMTSLVIDKMAGERTLPNKELAAQGIAHAAVACIGGIAGAQATIRSVLMVKEGATARWAGVLVGVFALVEMLIFQDWIKLIPQAVFAGVLLKVGYDVFDWLPLRIYATRLFGDRVIRPIGADEPQVETLEIVFVLGTALVTVFFDLNIAVAVFTGLFYLHNRVWSRANPMRDLRLDTETEAFADQD